VTNMLGSVSKRRVGEKNVIRHLKKSEKTRGEELNVEKQELLKGGLMKLGN